MKTASLILVATALIAAGCKSSTSVETDDGKITTSTDNSGKTSTTFEGKEGEKVTFEGDKDKATWSATDKEGKKTTVSTNSDYPDSELGVAIYPGAAAKKDATRAKIDTPDGTQYTCQMTTADPSSKVIDFYKKELKEPTSMDHPGGFVVSGKNKDGDEVAVSGTTDKESKELTITFMVVKKKK